MNHRQHHTSGWSVWLLLVLLFFPTQTIFAQQKSPPAPAAPKMKPLEATIAATNYLPPEMYGQWSVVARLVETNMEGMFNPLVYEIWVLEQNGNQVTISNPSTGASATINVDKIDGNTATFHRMQYASPKKRISETPTVTVIGDVMKGVTINRMDTLKEGKVDKGFYAKYILEAERIKPARVRFGSSFEGPPAEFEIETLRHE